uniref:Uncharacterized protein n=1 Tax=uncultured prokaryote TaxID=198431 RepID=A0A0H5Q5Q6_9ZZZZ|nr:hypothetical protein [uncultured prokaryote]
MVARNRFVINGGLGVGTERWSVSLHFAGGDAGPVSGGPSLNAWCEVVAAGIDAQIQNVLGNYLSSVGTIDRLDAYEYGASGPALAAGSAPVVDCEGLVTASKPYQTCSVFTLRTGLAGASYRGRAYWPAIGSVINANGLFQSESTAGSTAARFSELLEFIAAASGSDPAFGPVVYSATRNLVTPVTSVEWDTVPDIQRRRADALIGVRTASPYPAI